MIFLIQYDRVIGKIVEMQSFNASERARAEYQRLEKELELNRRGVRTGPESCKISADRRQNEGEPTHRFNDFGIIL